MFNKKNVVKDKIKQRKLSTVFIELKITFKLDKSIRLPRILAHRCCLVHHRQSLYLLLLRPLDLRCLLLALPYLLMPLAPSPTGDKHFSKCESTTFKDGSLLP